MAKGGFRAGAGRKPGPKKAIVLGMDGVRHRSRAAELPPAVPDDVKEGLLEAPYWLPDGAKGYWERWAAQAIAERTLTPATAAGFTELCQRADYVGKLAAKIATLGADTQDALPYLSLYDRMAQKLEGSLARFKLTAFGKPATAEKPKKAANPFAAVGG